MTIFEKIITKEIPSKIIYENDDALAIQDVNPQAPVHILILPKKYAQNTDEILLWDDAAIGKYFKTALETAKLLNLQENGYRLVINTGKDGGQTVPYVHMHLLAGRTLTWPAG